MFDPKPALMKYDGKPAPFEIKGRALNGSQQIMASPWKFKDCGESGRQVSDLLPHFQKVVDKVTFVRSMTTDRIDHSTAQFTFVTGRGFTGFPSIGSWVSYALGSENQNLPAYIALGTGRDDRRPGAFVGMAASGLQRHLDARRSQDADLRYQAARQHEPRPAAPVARYDRRTGSRAQEDVPARSGPGVAHRELRAGRADAGRSAEGRRSRPGERGHQEALRHRRQGRRTVRQAVPDGAASGGEGRALRPGLRRRRRQLGHAQQHRRPAPRPVRVHRPGNVGRC